MNPKSGSSQMHSNRPWFLLLFAAVAVSTVFQNCGQPRYDMKDEAVTDQTNSGGIPSQGTSNDVICDPNAGKSTQKGGLVAELYYMEQNGVKNGTTVYNYFNPTYAVKSDKQVYFSQLNTMPQIFNKGFMTQSGEWVVNNSGNKLVEWFAFKYFSELVVTSPSEEGLYEFATLSDDGVIFEAQVNGQWQSIVSDDGQHAPRISCSTKALEMKLNKPVPIRVFYYQGPAEQISNVLHWRKISRGKQCIGDKECGKTSSDYFFDAATSTPKAPYKDFLGRGWKVVPSGNFLLPDSLNNPCVK